MAVRKQFCIYILSNKLHTVFYVGMSGDLIKRVYEHKQKFVEGFTKRYNINNLLYYEITEDPESAILREKQIKDCRRSRKLELINSMNPEMKDIYFDLIKS